MKRLLLLLSLISVSHVSFAQTDFCVPGARWSYYLAPDGGPWAPEMQNIINFVGDTLVNGMTAKKLEVESRNVDYWSGQLSVGHRTELVSRSADSIFVMVDDNWEFIFDYDVAAGDTRIVYLGEIVDGNCVAHDTMLVDSVWFSAYQGLQLKTVEYRLLSNDWSNGNWPNGAPSSRYMERLGFLSDYPFRQPIHCNFDIIDLVAAPFQCYTDVDLGLVYPDSCNFFVGLDDEVRSVDEFNLLFSNESLKVQNASNSTLHVYDILGKELFRTSVNSDNQGFDISHLPNGILMIVLESETSRITKKVIKTSN